MRGDGVCSTCRLKRARAGARAGARAPIRSTAAGRRRGRPIRGAGVPGIGAAQAVGARARSPDSAAYVIGLGASAAAAAAAGSISVPESRRECQDLRARHPIKFVRDNSREEKAKTDFRPTCPLVLLVFVTEKEGDVRGRPNRLK